MAATGQPASSGELPPSAAWRPTAPWANLRVRAELLRRLREFFTQRGFLEVETPLLSQDTVIDRHIEPLAIDTRDEASSAPRWLQTSPEFGMKRLLAAGAPAIYQTTRSFRGGESGTLHNPEFTIVEWYRPGDDLAGGIRLLSELCETLLERGPATLISYAQAFRDHVGLDPHRATSADLRAVVATRGIAAPESLAPDDRDAWLDLLLVECVEPQLGRKFPAILHSYPASQAALAQTRTQDGVLVAERFELYVEGIELANGFQELLDAHVLRQRNARNNALRAQDGHAALPEASRLLGAMDAGFPACAGCALGFDRVVMLATGARSIAEVIPFPWDRA